jgi:hypothetical protein
MMVNVTNLKAVTSGALSESDLETRCRSIARNAVQASREAHGRGATLYTDDEAKRERMIEQILRLDLTKYGEEANHISLVSDVQPQNKTINKIADILEKSLEEELFSPDKIDIPAENKEPQKTVIENKNNNK